MKLANRNSNTSFYETFSDLMFSTLVIFVLIVLVLVVQFKNSINEVLSPNRFVGGESGVISVGLVQVDGDPHVAFIPRAVAAMLGVNHSEPKDGGDIVWGWSQYLGRQGASDGVFAIPIKQWDRFSPAFKLRSQGAETIGMQCFRASWGAMLSLQLVVDGVLGRGPIRQGPDQIYAKLGGEGNSGHEQAGQQFKMFYKDTFGSHLLLPILYSDDGDPSAIMQSTGESYLRFKVTEDRKIVLGEYVCEPKDLRSLLRSISPSMDFYLEYVADGPEPTAPPEWVVEEILAPVGWNRRVIADDYRAAG